MFVCIVSMTLMFDMTFLIFGLLVVLSVHEKTPVQFFKGKGCCINITLPLQKTNKNTHVEC